MDLRPPIFLAARLADETFVTRPVGTKHRRMFEVFCEQKQSLRMNLSDMFHRQLLADL